MKQKSISGSRERKNILISVSCSVAREDSLNRFASMLGSVDFADEIIIYAMSMEGSSELARVARDHHARIVDIHAPKIVEEIRARQIKEAHGTWVLVMDYDEIITPELKEEILSVVKVDQVAAYAIKRRNYSLGFPLRHGGWGDDYVVRLIKKSDFLDWPTNIHSVPTFKGSTHKLEHFMEHHKDDSLSQMVEKTNRYSDIEAQLFFDGGLPKVTVLTLIRKPVMEFIRRYFLKLGFLDGGIGLLQSLYQGYSVFISYSKLYEKQRSR